MMYVLEEREKMKDSKNSLSILEPVDIKTSNILFDKYIREAYENESFKKK